jgi:hypothetical protein
MRAGYDLSSNSLENDIQAVLTSCHSQISHYARMFEALQQIHFPHHLANFVTLRALDVDSLDRDELTIRQVQSTIHDSELSLSYAVAKLL